MIVFLIIWVFRLTRSDDAVVNYNDTSSYFDEQLYNETITEISDLMEYPSVYRGCPFLIDDPCECSISETDAAEKRFSVVCSDMDNVDILPQMMDKVRTADVGSSLHSLIIYRSRVELPRAELFASLPFRTVRVVDSFVSLSFTEEDSRSPDKFRPLLGGLEESLEEAAFRNTNVPGVESRNCALGSLSRLSRFSLVDAHVSNIPKEFFCCSYLSIEQVYLYGNEFTDLPDGGLSRATNLKLVILNHNRIFIVSRNFFPAPANKLEEIHLKNNEIKTLPSDFFRDMPALRYIDLSDNLMETLPPDVWKPNWSRLLDIYLNENMFICGCTFEWLLQAEEKLSEEFKRQRFLEGTCSTGNFSSPLTQIDNYFDYYPCQ